MIPTYKRTMAVLAPTLDSILSQTTPPRRIMVVNQTAGDRLQAELAARFPSVEYLFHETPGLPGARNRGLAACETDIILFCDDDVRVSREWSMAHVKAYQDANVAAVVGRSVEGWEKEKLPPDAAVGRFNFYGSRLTSNFHAGKTAEVESLLGCNMSFRTDVLREIGGFCTLFDGTSHLEESDVSLRLCEAGWKILFVPGAALRHLKVQGGGCRAEGRHQWIYWYAKNFTLLNRRHRRRFPAACYPLFLGEKMCWIAYQAMRRRSWTPLMLGLKGILHGMTCVTAQPGDSGPCG